MKNSVIGRFITTKRLQNYKSLEEYKNNIYISEQYYILLSIFEISLRNSIDYYFKISISAKWFESDFLHKDTSKKIKEAKEKILFRNEVLTHNKLLAELPFGFWISLFRKSYSNIMRFRDIKCIFPNLPSKQEKFITRKVLDNKLNHIRKFRNRIFHYEKVIEKEEYKNIKEDILILLNYFDIDLYYFANEILNNSLGEK